MGSLSHEAELNGPSNALERIFEASVDDSDNLRPNKVVLREEAEHNVPSIGPERLFMTFVDGDKLLPKIVPHIIASSEIIEGDGGAGTVKKVTFGEACPFEYVLPKVEVLDKDNLVYIYSVVEGDGLPEKLEKITSEYKFVAGPGGGTIAKGVTTYHAKGDDLGIPEDIMNQGKQIPGMLFKAVEKYLIEHPDAYN